jgi:hypothetical protein
MSAHLNVWAACELETPDQWADALVAAREWLDYSARNQVLLYSYGVEGPVAGAETWKLVPSTTEGRNCAVRAGEHGWPVRVPITAGGSEPDPYLGGVRPSRSIAERWEWRPVFETRQLARRPAPDALAPVEIPTALDGPGFADAAGRVARTTVRGRLRGDQSPQRLLADAAGRVASRAKAPPLDPVLREQVAWLVADRVGQAPGRLPAFDPSPLDPKDRWAQLVAVLDPARKLTAALGLAVGVDLTSSPLPRMEIVDDRAVPAGRRRRLPAASLDQLPVGEWREVGPYTADEWAARGERGAGRGAYLRLNGSAYIVAVEDGTEAAWRLEDVADRTGNGLLARGEASSLDDARADAVAALGTRYPALAPRSPTADYVPPPLLAGSEPQNRTWEPLPGRGRGRSSAVYRRLTDDITLVAYPGPGGRWLPVVQDRSARNGPGIERLDSTPSLEAAKVAAEFAGLEALRLMELSSPVGLDTAISQLATSDGYNRHALVTLAAGRLDAASAARLGEPDVTAADLAATLGDAGCTPATTVQVLHAEHTPAGDVAPILPTIGIPMTDGIRILRDGWDVPAVDAALALGATATEMRDAGCTATEILAARPRDVLRALPDDPHAWDLAAATMSQAGHPDARVVDHLVNHAPSTEAFAAGVATLTDDGAYAISLAVNRAARPDHLAALADAYDLPPTDLAAHLVAASTHPRLAVEALAIRCGDDHDQVIELAESALGIEPAQADAMLQGAGQSPVSHLSPAPERGLPTAEAQSNRTNRDAQLLASIPEPGTSHDLDTNALVTLLPSPDITTQPEIS